MLSYKLLQFQHPLSNFQEIDIEDVYISTNKNFIGGYVDPSYNLYQSKSIFLWVKNLLTNTCNNDNLREHTLITNQVQRQGKVIFSTQLPIYSEAVYDLNGNRQVFKYVKYRGYIITSSIPYSLNTEKTTEKFILPNNTEIVTIIVDLLDKASDTDISIIVPNDYTYIENGEFEYDGVKYKENENFYLLDNLEEQLVIAEDGTELKIEIFPKNEWKNKTKILIPLFKKEDIVDINNILRVDESFYNDKTGKNFYSQITTTTFLDLNQTLFYQSYNKIKTNCSIHVEENDNTKLYIVYNNKRYYALFDIYYAFKQKKTYFPITLSKEIIEINGKYYYKAYYRNNGVLYVDKEDKTKGLISQVDNNLSTTSLTEIEIENIPSIIIDETIYPIFKKQSDSEISKNTNQYDNINIFEYKRGQLMLLKYNNGSSIIYTLVFSNLNDDEKTNCIQEFYDNVINNIYWFYFNNLPTYNFNINGNRYFTSLSDFSSFENDNDIDDEISGGNEISFIKDMNYYQITLPLSIDLSTNHTQEEIIKNQLVEKEKEDSINSIIDMEKDIYMPCINNDNVTKKENCDYEQNLSLCNNIVFNLHFRTRDLNSWEIITNGNWFVSDYYDTFDVNRSDLLGFLKFNDKDVFFQKNKLKKSFLRLSFYDSPNPSTQNLLYYSTIFVDERMLYNKYIKNINTIERQNFYNLLTNDTTPNISVFTEFQEKNMLNEDKRLSCQLVVKNMFQATSSSDGYYIYLYRDFALPFQYRSIYMKAEFNHAGLGKTLQFMLPRKFTFNGQNIAHLTISKAIIDKHTEYEISPTMPNIILDNKNNEIPIKSEIMKNFNDFALGFKIQDIYYQQYIEFKIIYDEINHRYCYYLPFNSYDDNNNMILNLFELKINDNIEDNEN